MDRVLAGLSPLIEALEQDRLLQHKTAEPFFARVVELARERGLVSDAHFTVDGTLIDA